MFKMWGARIKRKGLIVNGYGKEFDNMYIIPGGSAEELQEVLEGLENTLEVNPTVKAYRVDREKLVLISSLLEELQDYRDAYIKGGDDSVATQLRC